MLCQFSGDLTADNSKCVTDWPIVSLFYKHGNTDGERMIDVIEIIAG